MFSHCRRPVFALCLLLVSSHDDELNSVVIGRRLPMQTFRLFLVVCSPNRRAKLTRQVHMKTENGGPTIWAGLSSSSCVLNVYALPPIPGGATPVAFGSVSRSCAPADGATGDWLLPVRSRQGRHRPSLHRGFGSSMLCG